MRASLCILLLIALAGVCHAQDGEAGAAPQAVAGSLADLQPAVEQPLEPTGPAADLQQPLEPATAVAESTNAVAEPATEPATGAASAQAALPTPQSLPGDFATMCQLLGPFVPLPTVKPDQLCPTAGFNKDPLQCATVYAIEAGLVALSAEAPVGTCPGALQTPSANTSPSGKYIHWSTGPCWPTRPS